MCGLDEELIPIDGGTEQVSGSLRIVKTRVDSQQMAMREFPSLKAIDMTGKVGNFANERGRKDTRKPSVILAREGTEFVESGDRSLRIRSGAVFMNVTTEQVLATPLCHVQAKKDSVLSMESDGTTTRVRSCSGPGHVEVVSGGNKLQLNPGQELFLSADAPHQADILPNDGIGRRNLVAMGLRTGIVAVLDDFSIPSYLASAPEVQPVRKSQDGHADLFNRLVKTAAVVQMVTSYRGQYYLPPAVTAAKGKSNNCKNSG